MTITSQVCRRKCLFLYIFPYFTCKFTSLQCRITRGRQWPQCCLKWDCSVRKLSRSKVCAGNGSEQRHQGLASWTSIRQTLIYDLISVLSIALRVHGVATCGSTCVASMIHWGALWYSPPEAIQVTGRGKHIGTSDPEHLSSQTNFLN